MEDKVISIREMEQHIQEALQKQSRERTESLMNRLQMMAEEVPKASKDAVDLFKKNIDLEADKLQKKMETEIKEASAKVQEEIMQKYQTEHPAQYESKEDANLRKFIRSMDKE